MLSPAYLSGHRSPFPSRRLLFWSGTLRRRKMWPGRPRPASYRDEGDEGHSASQLVIVWFRLVIGMSDRFIAARVRSVMYEPCTGYMQPRFQVFSAAPFTSPSPLYYRFGCRAVLAAVRLLSATLCFAFSKPWTGAGPEIPHMTTKIRSAG